jgi:hypothetical protein
MGERTPVLRLEVVLRQVRVLRYLPGAGKRDATAASGDRSIANIGWLYLHDAAALALRPVT